jgi:hypothetical protein
MFVKHSADGGSLSISKDAGEMHKATSIIPKKRRPSIDEFGFRLLRNPLQWLDQCRHCQAASGNCLAGEGSGSACHCILVQCGRLKGRNKIGLWTKKKQKETRILTHLKTFELYKH